MRTHAAFSEILQDNFKNRRIARWVFIFLFLNLIWSGETNQIKVAGAGNEHVPFQVVITTPVPPVWSPKAPDGFFIWLINF